MRFPPEPETTEILRGTEDTTRAVLLFFTNANTVSACADSLAPSIAMGVEPIKKCYEDLKRRNSKVRWITEITKDNLSYCRALMQYAEVRHLDGIKGNFGVSDLPILPLPPSIKHSHFLHCCTIEHSVSGISPSYI